MAYKVIHTFTRPNTGVDFPKMADHDSDYYDFVRQYYTDNGISISFDLSEDELTLVASTECANRAAWDAWKVADDADGRLAGGVKAGMNSDLVARGITIKIDADEDGTVTNLVAEGNNIP
tara:strand:+ start:933 stop:1292 length:360 start_codon:yes stop_codon:yes gene_type:complete